MDRPDPATQTPDLQAMTGVTPPSPLTGPSILSALGSMQGPSPGLAAGSGMLNSLGGGPPGANPYLAQHNQAQQGMLGQVDQVRKAQQADQHMQMQQQMMQQRIQALKVRQFEKQHESKLKMIDSMTESDSPEARMYGWGERAKVAKTLGMEIPEGIVEGLARGKFNKDELGAVVLDIRAGVDPATMLKVHPNLRPEHMMWARQLATSPDYLRRLGIDDEELGRKRDNHELNRKKYDLDIMKEARVTEENQAKLRQGDQGIARQAEALAETKRHNKAMEALSHERNETKALSKDEKKKKSLDVMEQALDEIETTALNLKNKGYFHTSTAGTAGGLLQGAGALLRGDLAGAKKGLEPGTAETNWFLFPNDSDLKNWKGPLRSSVIGMDRQILDEIGARGAMIWKEQMEQFMTATSYDAAVAPARMMRKFLQTAREGKTPQVEHVIVELPNGQRVQEKSFMRGVTQLPPGGRIIKVVD